MGVAEKFCDELAIILGGKVVAEGTVSQVIASQEAEDSEEAFFKLYEIHEGEA